MISLYIVFHICSSYWLFRLFIAMACEDPGTPHDGQQDANSFESGQLVKYTCDRAGFTPDNDVIICNDGTWEVFDEATMMSTGTEVTTSIDMRPTCNGGKCFHLNIP